MNLLPPREEMLKAFFNSDASYDGVFFIAVTSTGIFCRPSCPARKPLPSHVEFFGSLRQALVAGYHPCKRCRPLEFHGAPPDWIEGLLKRMEANPDQRLTSEDVRAMQIDPARVRRYFLRSYGITFHAFCRRNRLNRALQLIRGGADLDDVAYDHGYESNSGFREAFAKLFGVPPGRSRGAECITLGWMETPLGALLAGATEEGVCLLEFSDGRRLDAQLGGLRQRLNRPAAPGEHEHLARLKQELNDYFGGRLRRFTVPLVYPGTPFQQQIWEELIRIPYGETRSYHDVARALGKPGAVRAVGQANGANRIAIVIPCHRVVNNSGELGGYGGGLWRKRFLLNLERGEADRRP